MKLFLRWAPVILWMAMIFLLSGRQRITVSEDTVINFLIFKTLHVIEYAFLFILWLRAIRPNSGIGPRSAPVLAFVLTVLYAASDEVHQTFVPTREGHIRDVIIDAFGASLSWILISQLPKMPEPLKRWGKKLGVRS